MPQGLAGGSDSGAGTAVHTDLRQKLEGAAAALEAGGFAVLREEWPRAYFEYLGREENVLLEALGSA